MLHGVEHSDLVGGVAVQASELEVDHLYSPFQPQMFCGSMVSATSRSLLVVVQYLAQSYELNLHIHLQNFHLTFVPAPLINLDSAKHIWFHTCFQRLSQIITLGSTRTE